MALSIIRFSPHIPKFPSSPHRLTNNNNNVITTIIRSSSSSSSNSSSSSSSSFDLRSYWTTLLTQVNSSLSSAVPVVFPDSIHLSMRHSLLSPAAKRAPPVLCIAAACDLLGSPLPAALPTACALEMVHSASLVHDDLPCMDASPLRRGRPSTHSLFGPALAVLAGDALFPLAFHHIISQTPASLVPPSALLAVISEISRAVGSTGMAAGQCLDLTTTSSSCSDDILEIVDKKFGEMAECSAACGGIIGGGTEEEVGRLRKYGRAVGVLYQLVDDVLMEEANGTTMRSNGSVVRAVGMERALEMVEELRETAKRELDEGFGDRYGDGLMPLYSFVDYAVERGFDAAATAAAVAAATSDGSTL
ncbi:heterodimeric geranylgeranyl pyrophosphate synthase small subunit, chloroplastic [Iris pallida]|uniref:Heterodimeric geranylgeranyl pyrophosphate synthase small subunit, chloroplastic n=1 Tax=Iris pallida TaxID=29817 RepID=A0AAX6EK65_IRIPA|nr:heterodimeric geranylgeranyl pyrophosphate synthase small subunit, chloroplastic [Iris pallida]KAJ6804557.1 heterodimeric geranylgeranyl pyrophosphate synthase small subunit, chloroplastic [Iris pallida]